MMAELGNARFPGRSGWQSDKSALGKLRATLKLVTASTVTDVGIPRSKLVGALAAKMQAGPENARQIAESMVDVLSSRGVLNARTRDGRLFRSWGFNALKAVREMLEAELFGEAEESVERPAEPPSP